MAVPGLLEVFVGRSDCGMTEYVQEEGDEGLRIVLDLGGGLHPVEQEELVFAAGALEGLRATCYSPYLVDHLMASEVLVVAKDDNGCMKMARLNTHPEWQRNEGIFMAGEFWSTVGEVWVLRNDRVQVGQCNG